MPLTAACASAFARLTINQGKDMKRIVMVLALLSACASDQPMEANTGAAGGAALYGPTSCTEAYICQQQRSHIAGTLGGTGGWTWTSSCSSDWDTFNWYATSAGGARNLTATKISGQPPLERWRSVHPSQASNFTSKCQCTGINVVSCHY